MTNQEFLTTFQHYLHVGGQQRVEIIAEIHNHLEEESAEKLGDPKSLAQKSNRVHLGIFSSFSRLVLYRIAGWILFEIIGYYVINISAAGRWLFTIRPIPELLLLISTFMPTLFTIAGAHAIGNMHQRWKLLVMWSGVMTTCAFFSLLFTSKFSSIYFPPDMNIPWWYATQMFESFIVTLLLSLAVITIGSGRRMWLPAHPWIDILLAFLLQGIGSIIMTGIIVNGTTYYISISPPIVQNIISWVENNPFTFAIIFGLLGGAIEAIRIYFFGKVAKKR